LKGPELHMFRN